MGSHGRPAEEVDDLRTTVVLQTSTLDICIMSLVVDCVLPSPTAQRSSTRLVFRPITARQFLKSFLSILYLTVRRPFALH